MEDYVRPLVEEYERLDGQLKRAEAEIAEVRARRNQLRAAVKALAPKVLGEASKGRPKKKYPVSEGSLDLVRAVVGEVNGAAFTPSGLTRTYSQRLPSDTTVSAALRVMHENGELRLVKTGRGGQKTYEVIQ